MNKEEYKEDLNKEIYQTEARIMQLKQTIFYAKEELETLEFDLSNMKKIVSKV